MSGTSSALELFETSFNQDLNGDGHIGLPSTVIELNGATDLTQDADHYFLYNSLGSGPSLKLGGTDFVAGQFGAWTPIGAEKTASGYEVAWKNTSSGQVHGLEYRQQRQVRFGLAVGPRCQEQAMRWNRSSPASVRISMATDISAWC